jgi:hypothetical protein
MNGFYRILAYLIYLPNVMPLKMLFSSEIFPWAFIYSLRRNLSVTLAYAIFVVYLVASAALMLGNFTSILVPARALFALLNASLIFFLLIKVDDKEFRFLTKAFEWVFFTNIVLGVVQFFGMFPEFLGPVMQIFIDRFTVEPHGFGRGVAGLFAEPSYMSMSIHYYFAFFMLKRRIVHTSMAGYVAISAIILFDIFIIRSITGIVMILVYLAALQKLKNLIRATGVLVIVSVAVLFIARQVTELPRSIEFTIDFVQDQHYKDPVPILLDQSGFRFVSVWAAYRYGFTHPFGSGIGGWGNASIEAMDDIGIPASMIGFFASAANAEYDGVRPTSFAAGLMLETGIVGLVLFMIAFWPFIRRKGLFSDPLTRPVVILFLFNIFALGSIGDPLPFIFFALAYRTLFPPETKSTEEAVEATEPLLVDSGNPDLMQEHNNGTQ